MVVDTPPFPPNISADQLARMFPNRKGFTDEMRRRIRVTSFADLWRERGGGRRDFTQATPAAMKRDIAKLPIGARGWATVRWKGRRAGAHIFSWVVEAGPNGKPVARFIDPQPGMLDASSHLPDARPKATYWMRVDDLVPTAEVLGMVRPRGV